MDTPASPLRGRKLHYEQKSTGYYSQTERERRVLKLVGGPGLRVLDVGCAGGHLGKVVQEDGNVVDGVDLSDSAAEKARGILNAVFVFDIEAAWPAEVANGSYDVAILGEVLEHCFNPVEVLAEVRRALKPGGRVVITVPNSTLWIARLQFLFGRFRYQKYGIWDFGHIRWFTYKYLKEVLVSAGLELLDELHLPHPRSLDPVVDYWPSLFAYHFIVSARAK
jgi:SAM-dependent methyltransferase